MAFIDKIEIRVEAGSGGNGCLSFRREKFRAKGGPDGGDGGRGGDVILRASTSVQDFSHLAGIHLFKARNGEPGKGARCHGKNAEDVLLEVPPGTVVRDCRTGRLLWDFDTPDASFVAAKGGKGGRGNRRFVSATNQAPRTVEEGVPGQARHLHLELKSLADIGLVGLPNAGKSTLLARLSRARPKIAAYPFTTLHPNIGVADVPATGRFVIADIPGLIENAHRGVGLGDEFLRHIERTRALVHVIDASAADPHADYTTIRNELAAYGKDVPTKDLIVVANKMDLPAASEGLAALRRELTVPVLPVCALTGEGIEKLTREIEKLLDLPAEDE